MIYISKSDSDRKGKQLGGKYVARTDDGVDQHGRPKYKYFETIEEYKTFLEGKTKKDKEPEKKEKKESLKEKLAKEHKDKPGPKKKPSLFLKKEREKE